MIKHFSFKHGWFYHFRYHTKKAKCLCNRFPALNTYLDSLFKKCPDHYFEQGPRGSHLKFPIEVSKHEIKGHEISEWTEKALEKMEKYKSAHSKVQVYMLEKDASTIAVEVPIWITSTENKLHKKIFQTDDPLTGHIDLLRIEDGKIWVWDYKPNAEKEKYAHTQVYFYSLMLSERTGIPLENFRCGYFDHDIAYIFKPELNTLKNGIPENC